MKIQLAEVIENVDLYETGAFFVTNNYNDTPFKVQYVTPYHAGKNGGLIAIPEVGSRVLICQPDNDDAWYYLGSTLNFGLGASLSDSDSTTKEKGIIPDTQVYKARGVPQRLILKSPKGNSLVLSDEYNPAYFNIYAELKSAAGKALKLIDSPSIDCVILQNEHGDRIKISSKGNDSTSPRGIEIEAKGPVDIITRESSMNLLVMDGKELNITNKSSGAKRSGPTDNTPGNINITSEQKDINLTVKSDSGTIFVEAQGSNGHIVLKSAGKITIDGEQGVDITSNSGQVKVLGTQIHLN